MKTVVAETVFLGKEAFETLGETMVVPDRQIGPDHLRNADALIIRSKTKAAAELLNGSAVRFVGTATAGFEHMDIPYLDEQGIGWTAAPGCNADSVADYITAALLFLHQTHGLELEGKTIGIIGVGQVGSRVARRAEALGLTCLLNDPPRTAYEGADSFTPLNLLLEESDIVTLHVPLVNEKPWPTRSMADSRFFEQMKPGAVFINAARGKVLDNEALLFTQKHGLISHAVLDVWNPEPNIRADMLNAATIGTPHIAGHSLEGKLNGTVQVYQEACRFFGIEPVWNPAPLLPPIDTPRLDIDPAGKTRSEIQAEAVTALYDIRQDFLKPEDIRRFDELRAGYRVRREFKNTTVYTHQNAQLWTPLFRQLGFAAPDLDAP